jgi:glycosyltransferase involved in cell wall biosynthesis
MSVNNKVVTIICLCYNHAPFVEEAMRSVMNQSYPHKQVILVDDCSTDASRDKIEALKKVFPSIIVILNEQNEGNCRSFNKALRIATGNYVIDFATDDVMQSDRLAQQVAFFERQAESVGVVYGNAMLMNQEGVFLNNFYGDEENLPVGDVFAALLKRSFIMPSTMMIKKAVFDELEGYDASLTYEDFDFWIRSSRSWDYAYQPEILMKQRIVSGSHSTKFTQRRNALVPSTVTVCEKAFQLLRTKEEEQALVMRLKLVMRQCFLTENTDALDRVVKLLKQLNQGYVFADFLLYGTNLPLPINKIYQFYLSLKAKR